MTSIPRTRPPRVTEHVEVCLVNFSRHRVSVEAGGMSLVLEPGDVGSTMSDGHGGQIRNLYPCMQILRKDIAEAAANRMNQALVIVEDLDAADDFWHEAQTRVAMGDPDGFFTAWRDLGGFEEATAYNAYYDNAIRKDLTTAAKRAGVPVTASMSNADLRAAISKVRPSGGVRKAKLTVRTGMGPGVETVLRPLERPEAEAPPPSTEPRHPGAPANTGSRRPAPLAVTKPAPQPAVADEAMAAKLNERKRLLERCIQLEIGYLPQMKDDDLRKRIEDHENGVSVPVYKQVNGQWRKVATTEAAPPPAAVADEAPDPDADHEDALPGDEDDSEDTDSTSSDAR